MPPLTTSRIGIDVARLPEEAQRELMDFYEFLVFKYQSTSNWEDEQTMPEQPKHSALQRIVSRATDLGVSDLAEHHDEYL